MTEFMALEGIAGAGKSSLRDEILTRAAAQHRPLAHIGQFSWLSPAATRILIGLRAGSARTSPQAALDAACRDLALHTEYNLGPALSEGAVLADRFAVSTACLITLVHDIPIAEVVRRLADASVIKPTITVLLTTPPSQCERRLRARPTPARFGDRPSQLHLLAQLYEEATTAWAGATGLTVQRASSTDPTARDALAVIYAERLLGDPDQ